MASPGCTRTRAWTTESGAASSAHPSGVDGIGHRAEGVVWQAPPRHSRHRSGDDHHGGSFVGLRDFLTLGISGRPIGHPYRRRPSAATQTAARTSWLRASGDGSSDRLRAGCANGARTHLQRPQSAQTPMVDPFTSCASARCPVAGLRRRCNGLTVKVAPAPPEPWNAK